MHFYRATGVLFLAPVQPEIDDGKVDQTGPPASSSPHWFRKGAI